jgi:PDZ domain/Sel1 repeat/Putative peptidoglycan binding domain
VTVFFEAKPADFIEKNPYEAPVIDICHRGAATNVHCRNWIVGFGVCNVRASVVFTICFLILPLVCPAFAGTFEDGVEAYNRGDYVEAITSYRLAAEQGSSDAMNALGYMYENGQGLAKDLAEALYWYQKAADAGNRIATFNIGVFHRDGLGVKADQREAFRWFIKAAVLGVSDAAYSVAQAFNDGRGVTADYKMAADYMYTSLEGGYDFAIKEMNTNAAAWHIEFRRALQRRLRDAGFYQGPIDGSFGPGTKKAIKALVEKSKTAAPPQPNFGDGPKGWLGVRIQDIPGDLAAKIGATAVKGALVAGIAEKSPAEEAGIMPGDLIISWNGKDVLSMRSLIDIVAATRPGDRVEVKILRNWEERSLSVEVGKVPEGPQDDSGKSLPAREEMESPKVDSGVPAAADRSGTPMVVAFPELNVFAQPNVHSGRIGSLFKGDEVTVSRRFTDIDASEWAWACAGELCGWVGAEFLAPAPDASRTPAKEVVSEQGEEPPGPVQDAAPATELPETEGLGTLD